MPQSACGIRLVQLTPSAGILWAGISPMRWTSLLSNRGQGEKAESYCKQNNSWEEQGFHPINSFGVIAPSNLQSEIYTGIYLCSISSLYSDITAWEGMDSVGMRTASGHSYANSASEIFKTVDVDK
jgi:hypothetical protein